MRITAHLDQLALPRLLHHHRIHGNPAVFIETPREKHHEGRKTGEERYRETSYRDPWPDRA
jgi:hypothetical protein